MWRLAGEKSFRFTGMEPKDFADSSAARSGHLFAPILRRFHRFRPRWQELPCSDRQREAREKRRELLRAEASALLDQD